MIYIKGQCRHCSSFQTTLAQLEMSKDSSIWEEKRTITLDSTLLSSFLRGLHAQKTLNKQSLFFFFLFSLQFIVEGMMTFLKNFSHILPGHFSACLPAKLCSFRRHILQFRSSSFSRSPHFSARWNRTPDLKLLSPIQRQGKARKGKAWLGL